MDKLIISVSIAVIALSAAFQSSNQPNQGVEFLEWGWGLLLLAIVLVLTSLLLEQKDKRRRVTQLFNNEDETDSCANKLILPMNVFGSVSFILGLALLGIYLILNAR